MDNNNYNQQNPYTNQPNYTNQSNNYTQPQPEYTQPPVQYQTYDSYNSPQRNGMAIASLVLSIASFICCCAGTPCAILGLVFGILGRKKDPQSSMALAGIIISAIGIAFSLVALIWALVTGNFTAYVNSPSVPYGQGCWGMFPIQ